MKSVIIVIEAEKHLRQTLSKILTKYRYTVYATGNGSLGIKLTQKYQPELILVSSQLPNLTGGLVCQQIKENFPDKKVLIIIEENDPEKIARTLNLGADATVPKPISEQLLIAKIRANLRSPVDQQTQLQVGDLSMDLNTHQVTRAGQDIQLTAQEFKLLEYLMTNANQVLGRQMILSHIWGDASDVQSRVVDVYIGYLRKKIDQPFDQPLIHSIRGFGYKLAA